MSDRPNEQATTDDFEFAALDRAENYRAALIDEFSPVLKGRVLEVGAGIGQITSELARLQSISEVVAIEPEHRFCQMFRQRQPALKLVEGTVEQLGTDAEWNAIVCINVLEHIKDDAGELRKLRERLSSRGGHLCLFVPARPEIYAPIDKDFGHFRRYRKLELRRKLEEAGFTVVRLNYFNWLGYFAWWLSFCVLKKRTFDAGSVTFYDRAVFPLVHWSERRLLRPPFGQSLIAIARAA
jgi:SAM-dependent methyltransferase